MSTAHACATMAHRAPRTDAFTLPDAERLGQISTDQGRALVVPWANVLVDKGLLPLRQWLHKTGDSDANLLGWMSVCTAQEVWFFSQGGRVDAYDLQRLRLLVLGQIGGRDGLRPLEIVQALPAHSPQQRATTYTAHYRMVPLAFAKPAFIGQHSPQERASP